MEGGLHELSSTASLWMICDLKPDEIKKGFRCTRNFATLSTPSGKYSLQTGRTLGKTQSSSVQQLLLYADIVMLSRDLLSCEARFVRLQTRSVTSASGRNAKEMPADKCHNVTGKLSLPARHAVLGKLLKAIFYSKGSLKNVAHV
jgi:hypothetical protein